MDQATIDAPGSAERSSHATLRLLVDCAPIWVTIEQEARNDVFVTAEVVQASGKSGRRYRLKLSLDRQGNVEVRECRVELLPSFCPERHINEDTSFCIGYEAGREVIDKDRASDWWDKLCLFLLCQDTAARTGCWPAYAALSHGNAAKFQMKGEAAADDLGMRAEFDAAMQGTGWIPARLWQVSDDGDRLLNGRMACLCGRIGRRGRPKLRRECRANGDACPVILEAKRRDAEEDFWRIKKGKPCCGTMQDCPLGPNWKASLDRRARRRAMKVKQKFKG